MSRIYRVSFPIDSKLHDHTFFQPYYFRAESCPTLKQFKDFIDGRIAEATEEIQDDIMWVYELDALNEVKKTLAQVQDVYYDWPALVGTVSHRNTFVNLDKNGRQPLTLQIIEPHDLS